MTDKTQRAHAANNMLNSEVFTDALTDVQDSIIKKLLAAKTPEDREQHYQEWSGLNKAKNKLAVWAGEVRHNKETKQ